MSTRMSQPGQQHQGQQQNFPSTSPYGRQDFGPQNQQGFGPQGLQSFGPQRLQSFGRQGQQGFGQQQPMGMGGGSPEQLQQLGQQPPYQQLLRQLGQGQGDQQAIQQIGRQVQAQALASGTANGYVDIVHPLQGLPRQIFLRIDDQFRVLDDPTPQAHTQIQEAFAFGHQVIGVWDIQSPAILCSVRIQRI